MTHNKLLAAVRFALYTGAASAALIGTSASAQDVAPVDSSSKLETVVVTGSRIRQVQLETEKPVLTITRADIDKQGFQSVSDILQNISAVGTPPISRASPLSAGENAGGTFISLRNLGATRTLVLVNGKRLGISTSGFSDISTLPTSAVERIEVLKDGASAIYGSDAMAGVINIITRRNYSGAMASAYYGQYDEDDGQVSKGEIVLGFTGERGSLTMAAEWVDENGVPASARPYSAFPKSNLHPDLSWTTVGQFGGFAASNTNTNPGRPNGRYILRDGGNPYNIADYRLQNTSSSSSLDKSNTNLQTDLHTPLEGKKLFVDGVFKITDDIRFTTNMLYSNRLSSRTVAGYPFQSSSFSQTASGISANSYYNPLGSFWAPAGTAAKPITGYWRRGWEVPGVSDSKLDTYRFTGGFDGSFEIGSHIFDWDVGYLHNTNELLQGTYGNFNLARVAQATGPSFLNGQGRVQCGTAASPIAFSSCVPWNPFLSFGVGGDGSLGNPDVQNFLFQEEHATGRTKTESYTANIAGSIFTLPAGDLGFAVGGEHRREKGAFTPDTLAVTGGSTNLAAGPTKGGYSVDEVYAELQVPILADLPFANELSINLASRYSDYDTFGDTTNSKFGFKYRPIESLLFRGTWAEGFRAPTIANLYGGGSQTFSFFSDPCDVQFGPSRDPGSQTRARCRAALGPQADTFRQLQQGFVPATTSNAQTPVAFTSGSNPLLQPENSRSKTLGLVFSPPFVEGLTMSVDWWEINIKNTIVGDSPSQILQDCYVEGLTARCGLFTRDPALGYIDNLTFGSRNAGYEITEGYDFDMSYRLPTERWGNFSFNWNSTYTVRDDFVTTNDPVKFPSVSTGFSSNFRLRSNLATNWDMGDFGIGWNVRYYSGIKEACLSALSFPDECSNPEYLHPGNQGQLVTETYNGHGATVFNDLQFRWKAPWNATVSVGANNAFNKVGPVLYSQPSANVSYYGGFDIGRFYYARYTQRF